MHHCHLDRIGNSPFHSGLHSTSYFHVGRNWLGRVYSLLYRGLVWSSNLPKLHSSSYICVSLKKLHIMFMLIFELDLTLILELTWSHITGSIAKWADISLRWNLKFRYRHELELFSQIIQWTELDLNFMKHIQLSQKLTHPNSHRHTMLPICFNSAPDGPTAHTSLKAP